MLSVKGIELRLGRTEVLRGLDLDVNEQRITVLLGPNGSGKSSLLKVIAGALTPNRGVLELAGQDITRQRVTERIAAGITLVPQGKRLFPAMSVEENLLMGAYSRTDSTAAHRQDLDKWLERFPKLQQLRNRDAGLISGGEQQLVAIVRGLMSRPSLLLLDEPSIGVSPIVLQEIAQVITGLHAAGMTFVIVEQNVGFALNVAHDIAVLKGGRVAAVGDPDALRDRELLADVYFGAADESTANPNQRSVGAAR